jgi:hypothetical protein
MHKVAGVCMNKVAHVCMHKVAHVCMHMHTRYALVFTQTNKYYAHACVLTHWRMRLLSHACVFFFLSKKEKDKCTHSLLPRERKHAHAHAHARERRRRARVRVREGWRESLLGT